MQRLGREAEARAQTIASFAPGKETDYGKDEHFKSSEAFQDFVKSLTGEGMRNRAVKVIPPKASWKWI